MFPAGIHTAQDLIPEAILLAGALACVALGVLRRATSARVFMGMASVTVVAAALSSLVYLRGMPAEGYPAFSDGLVVDRYTIFLSVVLCGLALLAIASADGVEARIRPHAGEYFALLLAGTLGSVLLVAARELIEMWVALELVSVAVTVLVGIVKVDRRSAPAAIRLVALSGAGSAAVLYGMALLTGLAGSTVLAQVGAALTHPTPALALASALVVVGMGLKLGAAPLHQWTADVAEAVTPPAAGLLVALGLVAGVGSLARLLVVGLPAAASTWGAAIAILAVAGTACGNLAALRERRMRRLLADLAVAQAGTVLIGLLGWRAGDQGLTALLVALVAAGIGLGGAYAAIAAAEAGGVGGEIADYRGLSRRAPVAAVVLVVALLSLGGLPPMLGFLARVLLLQAAASAGFTWLLAVIVPLTVVGIVVAVRVAVTVVVDAPDEDAAAVDEGAPLRAALGAVGLAAVFLGVAAQPLLALALGGAGQLR